MAVVLLSGGDAWLYYTYGTIRERDRGRCCIAGREGRRGGEGGGKEKEEARG